MCSFEHVARARRKSFFGKMRHPRIPTSRIRPQSEDRLERREEVEVLFEVAGEEKFFAHGFLRLTAEALAQVFVFEQFDGPARGFFHGGDEEAVHSVLNLVTNA